VIINQTMAHTHWQDRDPIGWTRKLKESEKLDGISFNVIGVAQNVPTRSANEIHGVRLISPAHSR
jgi:hypothetical protein